ncbi:MAG: hypothetical protein GSR78_03285 [Desulfurococcales archaeon]|nr:hypothetical protein [Desulfurococcales archaeon]
MALVLLALMALSAGAPVLAQTTATTELEGYVSSQEYNITYTITGQDPSLQNLTLNFHGEGNGNIITGSVSGLVETLNKTAMIDASIDYQTSIIASEYSIQTQTESSLAINLVLNMTQMQPNQTGIPVDVLNLSITVTGSSNSTGNMNETFTHSTTTARLSLVDGMKIIGMGEGDIVLDIYSSQDSYSNMVNMTHHLLGAATIDFNSGNPFVDNQLAMLVYQMLSQANLTQTVESMLQASNATILNLNITVNLDAANAAINIQYDIRYQGSATLAMPGIGSGGFPSNTSQAMMPNLTSTTPRAVPVEPVNLSMEAHLSVDTIDAGQGYNYQLNGSFMIGSSKNLLAYTGIDYFRIDGIVDEGSYNITIVLAGSDPYTAAPLIKGLIEASLLLDTPVNVTVNTGPDVTVYELTESGLAPLTSKTYASRGPLAIVVEIGDTIVEAYNETMRIEAGDSINVPAIAFIAFDSIEVNASSLRAGLPEPLMLTTDYNISLGKIGVKLDKNSIIMPQAEIRVLTIEEANASLVGLGYVAAGEGIAVSGIEGSGVVVISMDSIPEDLVVVRVTDNGTVQELDYTVVDGKIIAVTPGFSMIIPAEKIGQAQTGEDRTQENQTNQTTGEPGQAEQNQTETTPGEDQNTTVTNETNTTVPVGDETGTEDQPAQNTTETTPPSDTTGSTGTQQEQEETQEETTGQDTEEPAQPAEPTQPASEGTTGGGEQASEETSTGQQPSDGQPVEEVQGTEGTEQEGRSTLAMALIALVVIAVAAAVLLRR